MTKNKRNFNKATTKKNSSVSNDESPPVLTAESLGGMNKDDLIKLILCLNDENSLLKEFKEFVKMSNDRFVELERKQNSYMQYHRRDTIEISGIPTNIKDEDLEGEVLRIYDAASVTVHGEKVANRDIQACHRIGKKGVTIVKFMNRKFANAGLFSSRNLKDNSIYDNQVYINSSLIHEFKNINYVVRQAKRQKKIHRYRVRKGITQVQMKEDDEFVEVTHKVDLDSLGIQIEQT